jgi:hypothetical protein
MFTALVRCLFALLVGELLPWQGSQLREIAACQFGLARMDLQYPAGLHGLADLSHTAYGDDELVAKAYGCGLRADLWIDNHNIGLRKGALLPGINKIANVAG